MKMFLAIAMVISTIAPRIAAAADQVGILTFTVDNLTTRFFEKRMPLFFEYNVPGTLFGQAKPITGEPGDLYWDDIGVLLANGWEFGAHGYSHERMLSEIDDDLLELELGAPAAYIYRGTGFYPTSFASPFGDYDERVLERVRIYYDAHLRGWGNEGINLLDATDHFRINRETLDNEKSVAEVCEDFKRAGREGYWLVLMLHRVVDTPTYKYENSEEQFEGVVKCAAELRDQGAIRLMSVKEALQHVPHTPR